MREPRAQALCSAVCGASPRDADGEDLALSLGNAESSFLSKASWKHGRGAGKAPGWHCLLLCSGGWPCVFYSPRATSRVWVGAPCP